MQRAARMRRWGKARTPLRRRPAIWGLLAIYAVLGFTWAMTNAPFSAPDESQHYLRAIGISDGHLVGAPTVYDGPTLSPKETAWRHKLTRAVVVPAGLSPVGFECELFHPNITPACSDGVTPSGVSHTEQTDVGIYQPEPYLLPAAVVRAGSHPAGADRLGRSAMLLLWLVLLGAAASALWDRAIGALSLIGLIVAATPMVVFMGSSLTDSGLEIIASVSFLASLLALTRSRAKPTPASWVLVGVTGAVLALSRSLSPLWVICAGLLCWTLVGGRPDLTALRRRWWPAALAGGLIVAAVLVNLLWVHIYGPHVSATLVPSLSSLHGGAYQLRAAWDGVIGVFGYEDVPLGRLGVVSWTALIVVLFALALWYGSRRERVTLLLSGFLGLALPIYLYAAVTSAEGIETQGRHILPLWVMVPLLSAEVLRRHAPELRPAISRLVFPLTCTVAAGVQLLAWWENSRRYAVGLHGAWWFLPVARWSPPGGWDPWVAVMLTLALGVVLWVSRALTLGFVNRVTARPGLAEQP